MPAAADVRVRSSGQLHPKFGNVGEFDSPFPAFCSNSGRLIVFCPRRSVMSFHRAMAVLPEQYVSAVLLPPVRTLGSSGSWPQTYVRGRQDLRRRSRRTTSPDRSPSGYRPSIFSRPASSGQSDAKRAAPVDVPHTARRKHRRERVRANNQSIDLRSRDESSCMTPVSVPHPGRSPRPPQPYARNVQAKLPGPPAKTLKRGKPGWRPQSASAVG